LLDLQASAGIESPKDIDLGMIPEPSDILFTGKAQARKLEDFGFFYQKNSVWRKNWAGKSGCHAWAFGPPVN
jgi:hypothetical protein